MDYELSALFAILAAVIHWTMHEASHALMSKAIGPSEVARFKPWPHIWREWLYLGRIEVTHTGHFNSLERAYFYSAPLILAAILLFVYSLLGGWFLLVAALPLIDVAYWLLCAIVRLPNNDGCLCIEAWEAKDHERKDQSAGTEEAD